jgi:hypothetical protein
LKSPKLDEIQKLIDSKFNVVDTLKEEKDRIFFLKI